MRYSSALHSAMTSSSMSWIAKEYRTPISRMCRVCAAGTPRNTAKQSTTNGAAKSRTASGSSLSSIRSTSSTALARKASSCSRTTERRSTGSIASRYDECSGGSKWSGGRRDERGTCGTTFCTEVMNPSSSCAIRTTSSYVVAAQNPPYSSLHGKGLSARRPAYCVCALPNVSSRSGAHSDARSVRDLVSTDEDSRS